MYETTADLLEDEHYRQLDVDLEVAQIEADLADQRAQEANGRCFHNHSICWTPGKPNYPEQVGLKKGQMRCTDTCGQIVDDPTAKR